MADVQLRGSCDDCHLRKVRCVGTADGCMSCRYNGRRCKFSPRSQMGRPRTRSSSTAHAVSKNSVRADTSHVNPASPNPSTGVDDWNFPPSLLDESPSFSSEGQNFQALQVPITVTEDPLHFQVMEPLSGYSTPALSTSSHPTYQSMESYPFQRNDSDFSLSPSIGYLGQVRALHTLDQFLISPNHDKLLPGEDPLLDVFLKLSNLQFDLHRQRDQLAIIEPEAKALGQVAGLASILQTSSAICTIAHSVLRIEEETNVDSNLTTASTPISGSLTNKATLLLMLTIILEDLKLFEVLVRISKKGTSKENQDSRNVEIGSEFGCKHFDGSTFSTGPCSFFINLNGGSEDASSISTALLVSSLTSYINLEQVLVLTVMDLQLSFFGRFLRCFEDRSVEPNVASSLIEGRKKMTQVRQELKGTLEASKKPWDH